MTANVDESLFETEEEQALFKAMLAARQDLGPDTSIKEFLQVHHAILSIIPFVNFLLDMSPCMHVSSSRAGMLSLKCKLLISSAGAKIYNRVMCGYHSREV